MPNFLKIASWAAGILVYIGLMAFAQIKQNRTSVKSLFINPIHPCKQFFISKDDIYKIAKKSVENIDSGRLATINTALLEETLENNPYIASAEVFSTLDGKLSINVQQKEAKARVITPKQQFYIDAAGHAFPTTPVFSAAVPVFTGQTDSAHLHTAFALLKTVENDTYFANWLAEIHTTSTGEIELIPVSGRHRVLFGTPTNVTKKLKKLRGFYTQVVTSENLNEWKTLNVAYQNQLITTKH